MKKSQIITIVVVIVLVIAAILVAMGLGKKTYKVSFDSNGGSTVEMQKVKDGKTAEKPKNPTKNGYTFAGWYLDDKEYDFSSKVTKDITLKAHWNSGDNVTVTFDAKNDTSTSKVVVEKTGKVSKPSDPTREGYTFVEWQLDGKKYDFSKEVTNDIVLTAVWKKSDGNDTETDKDTVKVTFNSNGGTKVSTKTVKINEKVSKPKDPTRSGYTFKGWNLDGKTYNFNNKVTKNITLTAVWEKKNNDTPVVKEEKYTVSFNSDGGSNVSAQTVNKGANASKPGNPTREGYTFVEWQLDGKAYDFGSAVSKDITLKAVWKKNEPVYTITFEKYDSTTPGGIIKLLENNKVIPFVELYGSSDNVLGVYEAASKGAPNCNKVVVNKVVKAKLTNGSIVTIKK